MIKETLKDFITEQLVDMGIENHEGDAYQHSEIFDRFDEFVKTLTKEELLDMVNLFINKK